MGEFLSSNNAGLILKLFAESSTSKHHFILKSQSDPSVRLYNDLPMVLGIHFVVGQLKKANDLTFVRTYDGTYSI